MGLEKFLTGESVYAFIPPAFSLFLSLVLLPIFDGVYGGRLKKHLNPTNLRERFALIHAVAQDRGLKLAYVTGIPSFLVSIIAVVKSSSPRLLAGAVVLTILVTWPCLLKVFSGEPGEHAMNLMPRRGFWGSLGRRRWTYLRFYSMVLAGLNVVLIVIIYLAVTLPH